MFEEGGRKSSGGPTPPEATASSFRILFSSVFFVLKERQNEMRLRFHRVKLLRFKTKRRNYVSAARQRMPDGVSRVFFSDLQRPGSLL